DLPPQPRDGAADFPFDRVVAVEVLPCRQQPLDHEGRFNQVAAVVVLAKERVDAPGVAVKEVGPCAMKAVSARKEANDSQQALRDCLPGNELTLRTDQ